MYLGSLSPSTTTIPSPLTITFPSNDSWTIYGRCGPLIYAQPHFITYPLFVPIHIQGDVLISINIAGIPNGLIRDSTLATSKFYKSILKILTSITANKNFDFAGEYRSLPFNNCRVVIGWSPVGLNRRSMVAMTEWSCSWEAETRSLVVLRNFWGLGSTQMPPVLPLQGVVLRAWLHDTVTLVSVAGKSDVLYAFKTNWNVRNLYQEIRALLMLPPHPNIVERPVYLVTKDTAFSSFHPFDSASLYCAELTYPIIAFLTPYYPGGTLKTYMQNNPAPPLAIQAKWARQLTSALLHVFTHGGTVPGKHGMYTALKMDNIVLDAAGDLRLIDFELAGTWVQYTPPEVLNTASPRKPFHPTTGPKYRLGTRPSTGEPCSTCTPHPCIVSRGASNAECYARHEEVFAWRFSKANILDPHRANSELGREKERIVGFWSGASGAEVEAAMVWMLACCLWCVFEGRGCLSELGAEWFPVPSPLWKRAKGQIPVQVEEVVGKALEGVGRPQLREVLTAVEAWERGEAWVWGKVGTKGGDGKSVETSEAADLRGWGRSDADFGNGKRPLGEREGNAETKKRKVGSDILESRQLSGYRCDMSLASISMVGLTEDRE